MNGPDRNAIREFQTADCADYSDLRGKFYRVNPQTPWPQSSVLLKKQSRFELPPPVSPIRRHADPPTQFR